MTMPPNASSNVRPVKGMKNVYSVEKIFLNVKYEEDIPSIIPFAKSKADILFIAGMDDKLSDPERVVI